MNVIVIHEDNHGIINIADSLKDLNISIEDNRQMDIDKINEFFDNCFCLDIDIIEGM